MPKRDDSSLILQNLKKRDLPALGRPVVALELAEAQLTGASAAAAGPAPVQGPPAAIWPASEVDSSTASTVDKHVSPADPPLGPRTRLRPRRRIARSALLVRIDPELHRRLDEVARYNGLTMNDIVVEAIELHLGDFAQPPRDRS